MFVNERELDLLDFGTAAERVLGDMRHQSVSKIVAKRSHSQKSAVAIRNQKLVSTIERMIGKPVPDEDKRYLVRGPDEIDLVNSGLEETMVTAY